MLKSEFALSKQKKLNNLFYFDSKQILYMILAFFIGRANILDKLTPFGIAFITAYIILGKLNIFILASTILGIFTFHGLKGGDYFLAIIIIFFLFNQSNKLRSLSMIKSSIVASILFLLVKMVALFIFREIFIYDLFIVIFEGIVVFALTYIFCYSLSLESIGKSPTSESLICGIITLSLVIAGIQNISIAGLSIKTVLSVFIILYLGFSEGAFVGGIAGISLGLISYISQPEMPFILSIYGLAGMLAGLFKDLGKIGSTLGFLLGNGIISFYINGYGISFIKPLELGLAIVLFGILYKTLNYYLSDYMEIVLGRMKQKSYSQRKDEITMNRLNEISRVFSELSATFRNSVEYEQIYDITDVYELIDDIANSLCANCGMRKFCWEEGFYTTYNLMYDIISLIEENKCITEEHLPVLMKDYCINKDKIIEVIKTKFDIFEVHSMWEKKLLENRLLVSEQLEEVANIIGDISKDIYMDPIFKEDMEEIIYANLKNEKIDVKNVVVVELEENRIEIYIDVDKTYKANNSKENIKKIVSNTIGIPLKEDFTLEGTKRGKQSFKFVRSNRYSAFTEIAVKANSYNDISGDNYTFGEGDNNYFIAISDGMGVGKRANNESSIAIKLLESFLEAKFDKEITLKTINSILMLKSNDEIFTTLDISLLDLYSGKLQIIKTGAPATFIKRKDEIKIINSQSLPVGILKNVDFNIYEEYIEDGDIIIMMSDGVLESNEQIRDGEQWMKDVIRNIDSVNPKTIADSILEVAEKVSKHQIKDDMTVLVTKVWKNR